MATLAFQAGIYLYWLTHTFMYLSDLLSIFDLSAWREVAIDSILRADCGVYVIAL